jgi:fatty-acyl-CoA synthase
VERRVRLKQGLPVPGVELRLAAVDTGALQPWDGKAVGEIQVRGPWVTRGYYRGVDPDRFTADGWLRTGDVANVDPEGYIQIVDRTKDLVKSGGEWISSVELESAIMGHPKVLEAAVIGVPHPKWQERPVAYVVPKPEHQGAITQDEILAYLQPLVAKWWLPDEVRFVDEIPKTSVGKFDKKVLREIAARRVPAAVPSE